jgi:hypothetical protein
MGLKEKNSNNVKVAEINLAVAQPQRRRWIFFSFLPENKLFMKVVYEAHLKIIIVNYYHGFIKKSRKCLFFI